MTEPDFPGLRAAIQKANANQFNADVQSLTTQAEIITTESQEYTNFLESEAVKGFRRAAQILEEEGEKPKLVISKSPQERTHSIDNDREGPQAILVWNIREVEKELYDRDGQPQSLFTWEEAKVRSRKNRHDRPDGFLFMGRKVIETDLVDRRMMEHIEATVTHPKIQYERRYVPPYSLMFGTESHMRSLPFRDTPNPKA